MKKLISIFLIVILSLTFLIPSLSRDLSFAQEYILNSGDTLEIKVIGQKTLNIKQTVAPDGSISVPFLGRLIVKGQSLEEFDDFISSSLSKHIKNSHIVVSLIPRPIYVIQHDVKKSTWDVKEAKSVQEARALAGKDYKDDIKHGDIVAVNVSRKPDFFEAKLV